MDKASQSEEFQPDALTRKVLNLDVTFHWLGTSDRFWFKRETRTGTEFVTVDAGTAQEFVTASAPTQTVPERADWIVSPDERHAVVRKGDDLWLRDQFTGEERRLTSDGEPLFGYGDVDPSYERQGVARRRSAQAEPLRGVLWSPDSRFVIALGQDLRHVPTRLFLTEYVSRDGAYAYPHFRRIALAGDSRTPASRLIACDVKAATSSALAIDPQALNDLALPYFVEGIVWWCAEDKLFFVTANRGGTRFALVCAELQSGRAREVLHESARFSVRLNPFDYDRPNVHVTSCGSEVIWYSERSGHGHLYLYAAVSGRLKRQLTDGEWTVFDLLYVDESQRLVYFTAGARDTAQNPYYRYLYRAHLDEGREAELLTPDVADHQFSNLFFRGAYRFAGDGTARPQPGSSISPSGQFFVDCYSTTDHPPEYVLRRTSGALVSKFLVSDASALYAAGWKPPERVVARAADGITVLHGTITKPRDFNSSKKYPVIDCTYPGPQGSFAPRTFIDQIAGGSIHHLQTFADAGFIVVAIDGRGTAHRSRAFRDAFLDTEDVFGAADHVAAIRHLAEERPYMDLDRVGIRGQSFGGYGALRAMLLFPEFFKVGVAATGPSGYLDLAGQMNVERFFGVPCDDVSLAHYELLSNSRLASRLEGRVLLIYGEIDESVPLKHAFALFDAFIRADKDVDMLIVPGAAHSVPKEPYVLRRSVQYFIDHLKFTGQSQRQT